MFSLFKMGELRTVFGDLECLSIIIACLSHDLDHRGTNNQFQIRTMSPLVNLYSTSVLEHHHFDQCIMLLNTQGNEILCNLSHDEYRRAVTHMERAILATDLSRYFARLPEFNKMMQSLSNDSTGSTDLVQSRPWDFDPSLRELLSSMLMTACDISASTKPWPVQKKTAELVASEFFEQGDLEKRTLNIKPETFMDRDFIHQLPQMQIDFIDTVCAPVYQAIVNVCGKFKPLLDGCLANRECWQCLADGVSISENLMRLPSDDDGGPAYRDRMLQLLSQNRNNLFQISSPSAVSPTTRPQQPSSATAATTVGGTGSSGCLEDVCTAD